ncbi:glucose-6-phosphate dehydrogenase [Pseudomonas aeruginosa]
MPNVRVLPCTLALFGALGDLALRKLFPALYQLDRENLLHRDTRVLALARDEGAAAEHLATLEQRLRLAVPAKEWDDVVWQRFRERLDYLSMDFLDPQAYVGLREAVDDELPLVAYFATPASVFGGICENLAAAGLAERTRVVLEKPIGHDLESSREVNEAVARFFPESRIYRIDHYLGKETVQNLIALRFANSLFETQWNQNHISHVEITVAEKVGIEGRWGYFDQAGQLRDMVQNHLLQLLCLIAMDPPSDLSADSIRDEKVKVLRALEPIPAEQLASRVVRGQYTAGFSDGKAVPGYLEEEHANRDSDAETFVALRVDIRNWRWSGVPFYLRTGKRMPQKLSQIVIHFKEPPHYIFAPEQRSLISNRLIIRLQPDEGISLQVMTKDQGLGKGMQLRTGPLQLSFSETYHAARIPDAYERLLLEVTQGNQYLFVRKDEVEFAWKWCDQLIAGWERLSEAPKPYPAGSWGPVASVALVARDGRSWYGDF